VNRSEYRYWVALSYFLDVLATLESIARLKYIIVCRLNNTILFTVAGRYSLDDIQRAAVQKYQRLVLPCFAVWNFFQSLLAVTDHRRIFSGSVVVWRHAYTC